MESIQHIIGYYIITRDQKGEFHLYNRGYKGNGYQGMLEVCKSYDEELLKDEAYNQVDRMTEKYGD